MFRQADTIARAAIGAAVAAAVAVVVAKGP
jgi:hypothetical protein